MSFFPPFSLISAFLLLISERCIIIILALQKLKELKMVLFQLGL